MCRQALQAGLCYPDRYFPKDAEENWYLVYCEGKQEHIERSTTTAGVEGQQPRALLCAATAFSATLYVLRRASGSRFKSSLSALRFREMLSPERHPQPRRVVGAAPLED